MNKIVLMGLSVGIFLALILASSFIEIAEFAGVALVQPIANEFIQVMLGSFIMGVSFTAQLFASLVVPVAILGAISYVISIAKNKNNKQLND